MQERFVKPLFFGFLAVRLELEATKGVSRVTEQVPPRDGDSYLAEAATEHAHGQRQCVEHLRAKLEI